MSDILSIEEQLRAAKALVPFAASLSAEEKRRALSAMAEALSVGREAILAANAVDLAEAKAMGAVMLDRLLLTEERIEAMKEGILQVASLPDPVGRELEEVTHPKGMLIKKISVPFGLVAVIFESRPNVAADTAALCLMSGNLSFLRCGRESYRSCAAIVTALQKGLSSIGLPEGLVNLAEDRSREGAVKLMQARGLVDLLIPRGGAGLIRTCLEKATVPCIETGTGICHIYVDRHADFDMALSILENAKTSRPSVCNAAEVCLVDRAIASAFLPLLHERLVERRAGEGKVPVELKLDEEAASCIAGTPAEAGDFDREFLDYILAVKVVDGLDGALSHIASHSTHHSEAIITADEKRAECFLSRVDSAAVYVNASTRFTDGGEFGKGCEIGISTQKLHARGPMGLSELNTYKYIIRGSGQIR